MMKTRLAVLCLHLGMFAALLYGYQHYVVPIYSYEGYRFEPGDAKFYVALAAVMAASLITPVTAHKPSTLFYQLIVQFVLIPLMVMFYAQNEAWQYPAQVLVAYAVCLFLPGFVRIPPSKLSFASEVSLRNFLLAICALYIGAILMMGGAAYMNFDIGKVYEMREDASKNLPGIFSYISPLVGKVVVPVAFVLSLLQKRYLLAAAALGAAVLIFGLTSHKSTLFSPFLILLIYFASRTKGLTVKLNIGILAVLLASLADFQITQTRDDLPLGWIGDLLMRRVFFVPAHLNLLYYDFFSKNDWVLFANSKLSLGLFDYEYPFDVANLIGLVYFGNERMSANTGWIGSGYMQAGFAGLILYGAVIGLIFRYIDTCARVSGNPSLITAAIVVPIFSMVTSSDLPTALFTHGLFLNLLLIASFHTKKAANACSPSEQRSLA